MPNWTPTRRGGYSSAKGPYKGQMGGGSKSSPSTPPMRPNVPTN